jgi:hypothetical protein
MSNQCGECQDEGHPDHDEDVKLVVVRDPDDSSHNERIKLCREHRKIFAADGFQLFGAK